MTLCSCFALFIDLTNLLFIVNSFRGSRVLQSSTFNLIQFRMLPNLTVNKLFGIVILFSGGFHGLLCRQNTGGSSTFCPSLTAPQPSWPPCCSSYIPDPLPPQGLCTCCFLCLRSSFFHGLHPDLFKSLLKCYLLMGSMRPSLANCHS